MDLLERFGVSDADLLGEGGEARVYALSDETVLRVLKAPPRYRDHVVALRSFYDTIATADVPFDLPRVHEVGEHDGRLYTVDARMHGVDFAVALRTLDAEDRERAYRNYLEAATWLARLPSPGGDYGEILTPEEPLRRSSWRDYLTDRSARALERAPELRRDVPGLDEVVALARATFAALDDDPAPVLVHGDYFPGNVLLGDDLGVSAVLDFGPMTVVGDARLDLASAVFFAEVCDAYRAEDGPSLLALLEEIAPVPPEVITAYRLYYSLYFAWVGDEDAELYSWCVANLNSSSTT